MRGLMLTFVLMASIAQAQQPPNCAVGGFVISPDQTIWVCAGVGSPAVQVQTGGGGSVPAGSIVLIKSGTCPAGYAEDTDLTGRTIIGTVAANGDVGTTGGSDTITQVINHTHTVTVTDPGHTHNQGIRNTGTAGTAGVQGGSAANNATIANAVPSAVTGITASSANPAGGVASIDNRSAWIKVIPCRKT